ncbi:MAG: bifunctional diaminohydroxyphosphoribosylaminopyrimidine deaminase/5-amino-6-(5-phosphoribosylamino)uracil reductase RibD [Tannerellaceae bacterium]|jgi:diaminohydroxyphosphoribosylaminopyrimidine deaminase/5-amino-6-(5-phosphoribosylamino)uracil reductase|nr:bifunctional diaminohydroxyphosphoribosylaminopyrimidine deaminase/5-amino-6-(5-phosphoribosylamino)uracil reductase RibD [Tannerellaceae bacterium]
MEINEAFMSRCLTLAAHGAGKVSPNPMVGAVIVYRGSIIGEGYHRKYGDAHAEVIAVRSVTNPALLPESTMYVNLEPCSHYGKTPPCAGLIIDKRIPRVAVACLDPNPVVAGAGIEALRQNGVEVVTGVLEKEARELNREFLTFHTAKRPYIYIKWAQSSDGFIDRRRESCKEPPARLSSDMALQWVHKKRSEVAAIMVGTRTALLDNPALTVRRWAGRSPVRITFDRRLAIPSSHRLLDGSLPTLVFTEREEPLRPNLEYIRIDFGGNILKQTLDELYARRIISLLVEGGAALIESFVKEDLWDEIQIETVGIKLGEGVKAPVMLKVKM